VLSRMRIDALVVTRSVNGAGFATWTWRHPVAMAVAEGGARSSANDKVIFQGQLNEFVEVCLWASADRDGSLTLEELLAQHPDRAVIDDATRALSLISCAPRVRAVAASAALARISDDLLVAATEHCSGTFRCSFDWRTVFGSGRIPAIGSHHAREFSFALSIVPGGELTKD